VKVYLGGGRKTGYLKALQGASEAKEEEGNRRRSNARLKKKVGVAMERDGGLGMSNSRGKNPGGGCRSMKPITLFSESSCGA